MVTPSSRDYHTVRSGSPAVRSNEGGPWRLEAQAAGRFPPEFTRQMTNLDVTVLPEIKTVWEREGWQALCTCSIYLLVQFNTTALANSPGNERRLKKLGVVQVSRPSSTIGHLQNKHPKLSS